MLRRLTSMWLGLSAWRAGLLLIALCVAVYGPGLVMLPVIDRDEARFAQASRQMFESVALPTAERDEALHSGGVVVPKVGGRDRINKPPLIYWLQAGSAGMFTLGNPLADAIWMYRVPSLIAAIVTVLVLWRAASLRFGPRIGLLAPMLLAVCPLFAWEARQARADMVLLACTTVAMAALWSLWDGRGRSWRTALVLWIAIAAGVMTKGPITLLVVVLAALVVSIASRRWSWLLRTKPLLGAVIVAGVVAPWVWAVGEQVGHAVFWQTVFDEVLGRSVEPAEGHAGPPGYHLVLSVVLFWPGAALAGREFFGAIARLFSTARRKRTLRQSLLFLASWLIPAWLVMELVSTKLPHYVLPLYPALAILSARAIMMAHRQRLDPNSALGLRLGTGLWRWLGLGLLVLPGIGLAIAFGQWWCLFGAAVLGALWCPPPKPEAIGWLQTHIRAIAAFASFSLLLPVMLALTPALHVSEQLQATLRKYQDQPIGAISYHEDSLVFNTRGRLLKLNPGQQDDFWRTYTKGILIVPRENVLRSHVMLGEASGFNYSKGRRVELAVVQWFIPMNDTIEAAR